MCVFSRLFKLFSGFISCCNCKLLMSHPRKLNFPYAKIRLVNSKNYVAIENSSNEVTVSSSYKSRKNCDKKVKVSSLM